MNETAPVRFEVVRFRLSKGDIAFDESVGEFSDEAEAKAFCEEKNLGSSTTPRWPDFDQYQVRPLNP